MHVFENFCRLSTYITYWWSSRSSISLFASLLTNLCFLPRFSLIFGLFWLLWCPSTEELLQKCMFVLFLLPIHLYYILVKSQHFNSIIYIIIDDFVIFTPLQHHFWSFFDLLRPYNRGITSEVHVLYYFCCLSTYIIHIGEVPEGQ